jgi:hypothetical protein
VVEMVRRVVSVRLTQEKTVFVTVVDVVSGTAFVAKCYAAWSCLRFGSAANATLLSGRVGESKTNRRGDWHLGMIIWKRNTPSRGHGESTV